MKHESRYASLDILRTLAIALVFTTHFKNFAELDWFKPVSQFGWIGVDLFFVLSGYLISSQLLKSLAAGRGISFKEFYIRRGLRIWPNFLVVLLVYLTVPAFTERSELPPLWKLLTFTQNFALDYKAQGAFSHAWSLCVEEQFYFVLPFLLLFLYGRVSFRRAFALAAGIVVGGMALRYSLWQSYVSPFYQDGPLQGIAVPYFREIYYPTYCRLDGLTIGVTIAAIMNLRPRLWARFVEEADTFFVFGLLFIAAAWAFANNDYSLGHAVFAYPLFNLGFGCLVIAGLAPKGFFSLLRVPGAGWGATLAFSFYLTHKQMIHLADKWLAAAGVAAASPLYPLAIIAVCLAASLVLYFLVERPFLRWRDRWLSLLAAGSIHPVSARSLERSAG